MNARLPGLPSLALLAFAWPALCVVAGCDCETVCRAFGATGCVAIASFVAVALFVPLSFLEELRLLSVLKPRDPTHHPKEKT